MSDNRNPARLALALLAAVCLTPFGQAEALQGDKFQVSTTPGHVWSGWPRIAMDAQGGFVAVWEFCPPTDDLCPSTDSDVRAQFYRSDGSPLGGELVVNTTSEGWQMYGAVAMDADGDSVVAWSGNGPGDDRGVFARRYDAAGTPQGGEVRVNATTSGGQGVPSVAMDALGNFVVAWSGSGPGDDSGIFAQRFDAAGAPEGGEIRVNTTTANVQWFPSVAMDADGDFVVAWYGDSPDDDTDIFVQRFDAAGTALGGEVRVNATTAGSQTGPSVAMDSDGDFVVSWLCPWRAGMPCYTTRRHGRRRRFHRRLGRLLSGYRRPALRCDRQPTERRDPCRSFRILHCGRGHGCQRRFRRGMDRTNREPHEPHRDRC
jgi:hypothetical protein